MPVTVRPLDEPAYLIEIDNGEGFGLHLSAQDAKIVYNELGVALGQTIAIHNVKELAAALNELEHLRGFRDHYLKENARVALKNQALTGLLIQIRSVLQSAGGLQTVVGMINETIGA